ncbi:MAG TPA: protein phosphatase CheZ [Solimonas sp.]|nr:protein phosphatase CheZ [Solimonas sp.]
MSAVASERHQLAKGLRGVLSALESGEDELVEQRLSELLRAREQGLFVHLARLTRQLHGALGELSLDNRLADLAGGIPDACGRLDYVVQVTEQAAHRTLDLVETTRGLVLRMQQSAAVIEAPASARQAILQDAEALRAQLGELAQTQEYQDIAGQTIKRVIALVQNVEGALLDLLRAAGTRVGTPPPPPRGLQGPALPGGGASQQDADELLASLGF